MILVRIEGTVFYEIGGREPSYDVLGLFRYLFKICVPKTGFNKIKQG